MWDIILRGFINGALFALIAVGLNLQYGVTRILNIAHGEFLMLGAFITSALFQFYGVNPLVSLAISGPTVFVIGVLIYIIVFRKLVHQSKSAEELEVRSLLACFGLLFVIQNVMLLIILNLKLQLMFSTTIYLNEPVTILGETLQLNKIVATFMAIIISVLLYVMLRSTMVGLALRATAQEPTGAQVVGINISKVHMISFGLSVLLSAVAGSLLSMVYQNLSPLSGSQFTFIALAVIVIGGIGSFIGSLVGGFLIGYVYYVITKTDYLLTMPVVYAFLIIMLLVRPKGLFGR